MWIKSTQIPHTYSAWQPLSFHVYWSSSRHPKIAQFHGYIAGLDISLFLFSQLAPKSFNDTDLQESSPHRYPTHILSNNHYHHVCICEGIGTRKTLEFTIISVYFTTFILSTSVHPKITRIYGIIEGLEDSQVLYPQLVPKWFNHWGMPDSSPHRYLTHILSHKHFPYPSIYERGVVWMCGCR